MAATSATFLTLALTAGTIEGSSILRHHVVGSSYNSTRRNNNRRRDDDDDNGNEQAEDEARDQGGGRGDGVATAPSSSSPSSVPSLIVPSLIYGAVSVPLGLIGGSPGPVFVNALSRVVAGSGAANAGLVYSGQSNDGADDSNIRSIEEEELWRRRLGSEMSSTIPISSSSSASSSSSSSSFDDVSSAEGGSSSSNSGSSGSGSSSRLPKRRMKLLVTPTSSLSTDGDGDLSDDTDSTNVNAATDAAAAANISSNTATATATAQRMREENRRALELLRSSSTSSSKRRLGVEGEVSIPSSAAAAPTSSSVSHSAVSQSAGHPSSSSVVGRRSAYRGSTFLTRYVSTLERGSFSTPLAEAMRRSRTLLVGAALVSLAMTQFAKFEEEKREEECRKRVDRYLGRDVESVRNFANATGDGAAANAAANASVAGPSSGNKGGVAIRLIDGQNRGWYDHVERLSLERRHRRAITTPGGGATASKVLPVVIGDSAIVTTGAAALARSASSVLLPSKIGGKRGSHDDLVYWRMGGSDDGATQTEEGMTVLPLSAGWLIKPSPSEHGMEQQREDDDEGSDWRRDDNEDDTLRRRYDVRPLLVVEADVSAPLSEYLASRYNSNSNNNDGIANASTSTSTYHPAARRLTATKARFASRMVEAAAVGRGVLLPSRAQQPPPQKSAQAPGESNDDEPGEDPTGKGTEAEAAAANFADIVTVYLTSGSEGERGGDCSGVEGHHGPGEAIFVNGVGGVAMAIVDALEEAAVSYHRDQSKDGGGDNVKEVEPTVKKDEETASSSSAGDDSTDIVSTGDEEDSNEDNDVSSSPTSSPPANPLFLVDAIGKGIRYTLRASVATFAYVATFGGYFEKRRAALDNRLGDDDRKKVVHLVSDGTTERWLREVGAVEQRRWQIVTQDTALSRSLQEEEENERCVVFVCCGSDDLTCDVACSVLSARPDLARSGRVVALLQDPSASDTLEVLARELLLGSSAGSDCGTNSPGIRALCVESIHEDLFESARTLLANGNRSAEVQDFMDERFSQ